MALNSVPSGSSEQSSSFVSTASNVVGGFALATTLALAPQQKVKAEEIAQQPKPVILQMASLDAKQGRTTVAVTSGPTVEGVDRSMQSMVSMLDGREKAEYTTRWSQILADLKANPAYFQESFQQAYKRFENVAREGKYGSMVRPSIVEAELKGVPEQAPISVRDAFGLAPEKIMSEEDVKKLFTLLFNPDKSTSEGLKFSGRYFGGFYKAAFSQKDPEFTNSDGTFNTEAAKVNRLAIVNIWVDWQDNFTRFPNVLKDVTTGLNSMVAFFEKNNLQWSPEAYRKEVIQLASAVSLRHPDFRAALLSKWAVLEPGYELAGVAYVVAPALPSNALSTLYRGQDAIDLVNTGKPEVVKAWTQMTGLPWRAEEDGGKYSNFVAYQFKVVHTVAQNIKSKADIAGLRESISLKEKQIAANQAETAANQAETAANQAETAANQAEIQAILARVKLIEQNTARSDIILQLMKEGTELARQINASLTMALDTNTPPEKREAALVDANNYILKAQAQNVVLAQKSKEFNDEIGLKESKNAETVLALAIKRIPKKSV